MPINQAINTITLISNEMYIYLFILNCDINFMNFSYQSHCWVQIFLRCIKILSQHHFFGLFYLVLFYHVKTHL
jgi:hypothetical protein